METQDAIPEDVSASEISTAQAETSAEQPSEAPHKSVSARDQRMAEIVASRKESVDNEPGEAPVPDVLTAEKPAAPAENAPEPEQMLTLKVDGIEKEMPLSKAKALLQKNMAADQRLQQASERERQVAEREQRIAQLEQQLQTQQQSQTSEQPSQEDAVTDGDLKELIQQHRQAIYDGEDEVADELMLKIATGQGRQTATHIDPAAIAQQTKEELKAEMAREAYIAERDSAVEKFKSNFGDIASDPHLFQMADQATVTLMEEHPDWRPERILQTAGETVRDWMSSKGLSAAPASSERQQRKQRIPSMPKASGAAYQAPEAPKPKTPRDVIAEMRKARHF